MSQRCRLMFHLNDSMSYHYYHYHPRPCHGCGCYCPPVFVSVPNSGPSHTKSVVVQLTVNLPFVEFQVYVPLAVYVPRRCLVSPFHRRCLPGLYQNFFFPLLGDTMAYPPCPRISPCALCRKRQGHLPGSHQLVIHIYRGGDLFFRSVLSNHHNGSVSSGKDGDWNKVHKRYKYRRNY